eukprot:6158025-Prymnesium_polylepis.1
MSFAAGAGAAGAAAGAGGSLRAAEALPPPPEPPGQPRGLFLYGDVGVGKTLLLDLFADAVRHDAALDDRMRPGESQLPPPV